MSPKPAYKLIHIPLKDAYFCFNCECIGTESNHCAACNSKIHVVSLDKLLSPRLANDSGLDNSLPLKWAMENY